MRTHNLGYPRIGSHRELKSACEGYWSGKNGVDELRATAKTLRQAHWQAQQEAGIELVACNDFSLYDHVLDMTLALGAIPRRYDKLRGGDEIELYFAMARGYQGQGIDLIAMEMTKWFDTNYHYIVPEFYRSQEFSLHAAKAVGELTEANALGIAAKPVLIGPVSYLLLGKEKEPGFHRLELLERLLPVYIELLQGLQQAGAAMVQVDEPFLALDLDERSWSAYQTAFTVINRAVPGLDIMLATYFEGLRDNTDLAATLPVRALHLDLVRAPEQLDEVVAAAHSGLTLSLGVIDGRNIWKSDLANAVQLVQSVARKLGDDRVMVAPSCSLLHVPYDCTLEEQGAVLPAEVRHWLAFARQKLDEVVAVAALAKEALPARSSLFAKNSALLSQRRASPLIHRPAVKARLEALSPQQTRRQSHFGERRQKQQQALRLPLFPTTTIGSFPQTAELRKLRAQLAQGKIGEEEYDAAIEREIVQAVRFQEEIGIDVLVHGEFERNDMVQYFAEQLEGCCSTLHGWVQSFGSRCVRPPIIYGDVERKKPMTVRWSSFAKAQTSKPVKGMVTGPVTILQWSFVRDDQPRRDTAMQLALAMRDEVSDLEKSGLPVIQIDEPAFREGLPLRRVERSQYLRWAVECFRLATSGVSDQTQIHTHMCYAEFTDIMDQIAALDADVITIETSRSQMDLLDGFRSFSYPYDIGPGVYDIHSPRIPSTGEMVELLQRALRSVPKERLWVNPDCGLKTRGWRETRGALANMVAAARRLREMQN